VLRETTSRGLCGLVCPSRTSERGGKGDCVKEGGGEEGERVKERSSPDPAQSGGHLLYRRRELRAAPRIVVDGTDDLRRVCTLCISSLHQACERIDVLFLLGRPCKAAIAEALGRLPCHSPRHLG
jgi:hypothetical protein